MQMVKGISRWVKHPAILAILISGAIGLLIANSPVPALAYDDWVEIDCNDNPVTEGDTFRLHIESVQPYLYAKETIKVHWTTIPGTTDESDYSPLHNEGQASNSSQTEDSRMGRTFYTTEDSHSEFTETFRVRADNAASDGQGAGACTIEIEDDDGPGAATTWVEGVPDNHGVLYTLTDSEESYAGTYHLGETIQIKQQFTEDVRVQGEDINIGLRFGTTDEYVERTATYESGSNTDTLTFEYQVAAGDLDQDGLVVADSNYTGNGAIVTVANGGSVNGTYLGASVGITHKVNGGPYVKEFSISSTPADGAIYRLGEEVDVEAIFDRSVQVDGTPSVRLQIGAGDDAWVEAAYSSGSDSDTLLFQYTVQANDVDPDGITLEPGYVDSEGDTHGVAADGTITSTEDSYAMDSFHSGLDDQSEHLVDGRPYITGVFHLLNARKRRSLSLQGDGGYIPDFRPGGVGNRPSQHRCLGRRNRRWQGGDGQVLVWFLNQHPYIWLHR